MTRAQDSVHESRNTLSVLAWVAEDILDELAALLTVPASNGHWPVISWIPVHSMMDLTETRTRSLPLLFDPQVTLQGVDPIDDVIRLTRGLLAERDDQPLVLICRLTAASVRALKRFASVPKAMLFVLGVDTVDDLLRMLRESRPRQGLRHNERFCDASPPEG